MFEEEVEDLAEFRYYKQKNGRDGVEDFGDFLSCRKKTFLINKNLLTGQNVK